MSRNWNSEIKQAIRWQLYFSIGTALVLALASVFIYTETLLAFVAMPMISLGGLGLFALSVLAPAAVIFALVKKEREALKQALGSMAITLVIWGLILFFCRDYFVSHCIV
jgi:hypothetical protein